MKEFIQIVKFDSFSGEISPGISELTNFNLQIIPVLYAVHVGQLYFQPFTKSTEWMTASFSAYDIVIKITYCAHANFDDDLLNERVSPFR